MARQITEITIARALERHPNASFIDKDLLLYDNVGDVTWAEEPCRLNALFLALCTNGAAHYSVDTKPLSVECNDVIIVSEDQVVSDFLPDKDCDGIAMLISMEYFQGIIGGIHELSQIFLFSRTNPVFRLTEKEAEALKEYFYLIKQKVDDPQHHFRKELVSSLIRSLIIDMSNAMYRIQQLGNGKKTRAETIFTKFIQLVEEHFRHERRVSWYADQLGITPKYLSESVKGVSKRRPNDWINGYVMMEIRVLLRNSSLTIKAIAEQLCFANQSFLGKYFKEHMGISPKEYRNG